MKVISPHGITISITCPASVETNCYSGKPQDRVICNSSNGQWVATIPLDWAIVNNDDPHVFVGKQ